MKSKTKGRVLGVIPARYGSVRFPGKPLANISGKTLIQRTYENALRCPSIESLIVATDHPAIFEHVQSFGGQVFMTSSQCPTGSDRIAEVLRAEKQFLDADIIVNVQGDDPCIDPKSLDSVIAVLKADPSCVVATPVVKIESEEEALSPHVVKCVLDQNHCALYFSRSLIPGNKRGLYDPLQTYYRHLGIYVYRREFLLEYGQLPTTPLQLTEDLEQLKILELGHRIKVAVVNESSPDVNVPEDIKKIEQLLRK